MMMMMMMRACVREIDDISDAFWECILTECGESAVGLVLCDFQVSHFS